MRARPARLAARSRTARPAAGPGGPCARYEDDGPPPALDPGALRDRLVASDPNRERLRTGLRAVLGAAGSAEVMSRLAPVARVPLTVWLPGVTFAMATALFVPEGPAPAERLGFVVVTASAAIATSVAGLSAVAPPAAGAALALLVVFAAVWSRRFAAAEATSPATNATSPAISSGASNRCRSEVGRAFREARRGGRAAQRGRGGPPRSRPERARRRGPAMTGT